MVKKLWILLQIFQKFINTLCTQSLGFLKDILPLRIKHLKNHSVGVGGIYIITAKNLPIMKKISRPIYVDQVF